VGIQLFGGSEDAMEEAARIAEAAKPDLIDINYGCPVHKVVSKGAGACLLQDVDKMVRAHREGGEGREVARDREDPLWVGTKPPRTSWRWPNACRTWASSALSIHGRTRAQLYKGPADWTLIGAVKNNPRITIPIFGNGDIDGPEKGHGVPRAATVWMAS
jgi:tRNA-dihydrouridine synthase B